MIQDVLENSSAVDLSQIISFTDILLRLGVDIFFAGIIILLIHYRNYKSNEFVFTYFMFNVIVFLLTIILQSVKISLGAAFGMFAVFSIIRYRTEDITQRDMTYLFTVIAVGLISATSPYSIVHLSIINALIVAMTFLLESNLIIKKEHSKTIQFEDINLIRFDNNDELISVLRERTGLDIHRVSISKVNYINDSASVKVFFYVK
jgi:hypothetical protein